jgi:hypothetical protein
MKLWMSAEIQADVSDAYREARKAVQEEVNHLLEGVSLAEKAEEWAFIAIILNEQSSGYKEIAKRSEKGKTLEFRLKIPHSDFLAASPSQRIGLVFDALSRSIALMEKLGVSAETQKQLREILSQAEKNLGVLN